MTTFLISQDEFPINLQSPVGERKINIDEINSRQDQILIDLDELDKKISEIIDLWTSTDQAEHESPVEQAA